MKINWENRIFLEASIRDEKKAHRIKEVSYVVLDSQADESRTHQHTCSFYPLFGVFVRSYSRALGTISYDHASVPENALSNEK